MTSVLKQYFRRLPTPLITYAAYDRLLACAPPHNPAHNAQSSSTSTATLASGTTLAPTPSGGSSSANSQQPPPPPSAHGGAADPLDVEERVRRVRAAVGDLPARHRDCLAFLLFHLARVVERAEENLMTSMNCAVVFAPTVMRPESLAREVSDTQAKTDVVQFMIEHCNAIFMSEGGA